MESAASPVDVLVVGAGPVGLACALEASRQGLSHVVVDKGALLNTLVRWPTHTVFFSTPELLEIGGHPFVAASGKPTRREGLVYYRKVAEREGLEICLHESVLSATGSEGLFRVTTSKGVRSARAVVVATGFFDTPNLLDVPGEDLPKVSHYYTEPFAHAKTDVLVVGGKNSAVEAALDLYRNGARVTMAVRKAAFGASVKYWLKPDIENRVKEGSIQAHFDTRVAGIEEGRVVLESWGRKFAIPNDFVFALTGYRPDFPLLRALGIAVTDDLHVAHDAGTMETSVPGLYVAGVVAAGIDIGKLFIENGRLHAVAIVKHLLARRGAAPAKPLSAPEIRRFQDGD
jgi:thioredoxin reductase (NADPH)